MICGGMSGNAPKTKQAQCQGIVFHLLPLCIRVETNEMTRHDGVLGLFCAYGLG